MSSLTAANTKRKKKKKKKKQEVVNVMTAMAEYDPIVGLLES